MATPRLIGIPYSPWSEKARWALDARAITWERETYRPLFGEWRLRRIRKDGRASVPVLVHEGGVIGDSFEIGKWANAHGSGDSLVPAGRESEVDAWNALAERGLAAGRVRSLHRVLSDREGLMELVPRSLRFLGPLARMTAAWGVRRTLRKYGSQAVSDDTARATLLDVIEQIRRAIGTGATTDGHDGAVRYLLGAFSLADIAASQVLAFVRPPSTGLKLGVATRRVFGDVEIAATCADVIAWRDALYARHRERSPMPANRDAP